MCTNNPVTGGVRNVKYLPASRFQCIETAARVSLTIGGVEVRISLADARTLTAVLPNVLAEHSVALAFAPLEGVL